MSPTERTRQWRKNNPLKYKQTSHNWYIKNKNKIIKRVKNYRKDKPWYKNYKNAHRRCNDINFKFYKNYGGVGIQLLMKPKDFKFIWFRDKAYLMKRPSVDRINPKLSYILKNCHYLELLENIKRSKDKNEQ